MTILAINWLFMTMTLVINLRGGTSMTLRIRMELKWHRQLAATDFGVTCKFLF
jgi:hypothetical protein